MKSEISYDPTLGAQAGGVIIDKTKLRPQDGKTLLFMLFTLLYTEAGRAFLDANVPSATGQLAPANRQNIVNYCNDFGVTGPDLQNAIVDAHVAGHLWKLAYDKGQPGDIDRQNQEKVYLQKMSFIMWSVWEDAKGHEFSLLW
jgi:hypothetical protein